MAFMALLGAIGREEVVVFALRVFLARGSLSGNILARCFRFLAIISASFFVCNTDSAIRTSHLPFDRSRSIFIVRLLCFAFDYCCYMRGIKAALTNVRQLGVT